MDKKPHATSPRATAPADTEPTQKPMRHYSMLSAIAYVVGPYMDDSPFTIDLDESTTDDACQEIGVYRVNCVDVELGRITVSYLSEERGTYIYSAVTHVPQ